MFNKIKQFKFVSRYTFLTVATFVFFILVIRVAWLSDDSAITLRSVLNFINGYGATFNIDERVQAYTHPLWFFIISLASFISNNVFYSAFAISIFFSTAVFYLTISRFNRNIIVMIFLSLSMILSKAFMDYATSGLENPLSHFLLILIILFAINILKEDVQDKSRLLTIFLFLCSLLYLNRPDNIVLIAPLALYIIWFSYKKLNIVFYKIITISLPAIVLILSWLIFSLIYYGFLFPNTAYAKLGTGINITERVVQGIKYFLHLIDKDPLTMVVIFVGFILGVFGSKINKILSIGLVAYALYILSIGGDFMEGRFFTGMFLISLIIIATEIKEEKTKIISIGIFIVLLGTINLKSNILKGSSYDNRVIYKNGIADERGFYHQRYALLNTKFKKLKWGGKSLK